MDVKKQPRSATIKSGTGFSIDVTQDEYGNTQIANRNGSISLDSHFDLGDLFAALRFVTGKAAY